VPPSVSRRAENESCFRALNERLEERALARSGRAETVFLVVCECAREECHERIRLPVFDYELVRARPRAFIVLPGHRDPELEMVVLETDEYEIVEKVGVAGLIAEFASAREPA
jgi:hypothetical protein